VSTVSSESLTWNSCATSYTSDQEHSCRGVKDGCGGLDSGLEVRCEAATGVQPGEASLHHPAPRADGEADLIGRFADDLDSDTSGVSDALGSVFGEGSYGTLPAAERHHRDSVEGQDVHAALMVCRRYRPSHAACDRALPVIA
jgi:hypothetical protein